jgi:hypothetical protein
MTPKERHDLVLDVARIIAARIPNPAEWMLEARYATERLGMDPVNVIPLGDVNLRHVCHEIVRMASNGHGKDEQAIRAAFEVA